MTTSLFWRLGAIGMRQWVASVECLSPWCFPSLSRLMCRLASMTLERKLSTEGGVKSRVKTFRSQSRVSPTILSATRPVRDGREAPPRSESCAKPTPERGEDDFVFLARLLHAGSLEVLRIIRGKVASRRSRRWVATSINSSFSSKPSTRCGERLSAVNGPATRTLFLSS